MTISNENRDKIDKMNRASQNVLLGTLIQQLDNVINAGSPINSLQFDINYTGGVQEGEMGWNSDDGVPEIGMPGGNVVQQIGTELLVKVVNKTGSLIPNGTVVYGNGSQGNRLTIDRAIASNNTIANAIMGMTTEDIENNRNGYVTLVGLVRDIDTSAFSEGQIVYLSGSVSGSLTNVSPSTPNTAVGVGIVTLADKNNGIIAVHPRVLGARADRMVIADSGSYFDGTNTEDVLQEIMSGNVVFDKVSISGSNADSLLTVYQNGSGSSVKFGDSQNYLSVSNHGEIRLSGSATAWDDLRFPASSINPPGGIGGAAVDTANTPFIGTLLFDSGTTEICVGQAQMPHKWKLGSMVSPHVHWSPTSTNTGSVVWQFDCDIASIGENYAGTYTTSGSIASYADGTIHDHIIADLVELDMTGKGLSNIILWRISRIGGNASDTYPDDARLLEFDIHYEIDSLGSNEEYEKNT